MPTSFSDPIIYSVTEGIFENQQLGLTSVEVLSLGNRYRQSDLCSTLQLISGFVK